MMMYETIVKIIGGTMSAMYSALHPEQIKNFILMAAPIDWSDRSSLLCTWTDERYFNVDRLIDTFGNAPPQYLQGSFTMLKPVTNLIEKYIGFYEKMTPAGFWGLNVAIGVAGGLVLLVLGRPLERVLATHEAVDSAGSAKAA